MNCKFYDDLINKDTKVKYDKEFYEKQNAIVMAVDNFEARTYLSNQCEKYNILYFNCRTDGPYANVQAFFPGITTHPIYPKNYKKVVPSCILKMFPSSINHCVLWSLNYYEKFFYENIKNIQIFSSNLEIFKISNTKNFEKCIKYSEKNSISFIYLI